MATIHFEYLCTPTSRAHRQPCASDGHATVEGLAYPVKLAVCFCCATCTRPVFPHSLGTGRGRNKHTSSHRLQSLARYRARRRSLSMRRLNNLQPRYHLYIQVNIGSNLCRSFAARSACPHRSAPTQPSPGTDLLTPGRATPCTVSHSVTACIEHTASRWAPGRGVVPVSFMHLYSAESSPCPHVLFP